MKYFLLTFLLAGASAFIRNAPPTMRALKIHSTIPNLGEEVLPKSAIDEFMAVLFNVFPEALSPLKEIDEAKIVKNPPKFISPGSVKKFRRSHHEGGKYMWKSKDIIDGFASKFLSPEYSSTASTTRRHLPPKSQLFNLMHHYTRDEDEDLIDSLEEYATRDTAFDVAEKFVAEAGLVAFSPFDHKMDESKVVNKPHRFVKAVKSSDLKKVLTKDPYYFNH